MLFSLFFSKNIEILLNNTQFFYSDEFKFSNLKIIDSTNEWVNWFDENELKNLNCIKKFIYNVFNLPEGVVHYINSEEIK